MTIWEHLRAHRNTILKKWFDSIADTYPPHMAAIIRKKQGFTNPVGQTTAQGIEDILDALISHTNPVNAAPFLNMIVRMRAVQDFMPSQAVQFVFLLKQVIREDLSRPIREEGLHSELAELNDVIDQFGLMAFDIFMQCREKLYDMKAKRAPGPYTLAPQAVKSHKRCFGRMERTAQQEPR